MTMTLTRVTRYTVSLLPEDHDVFSSYAIDVEYAGEDRWVVRRGRRCLDQATWSHESGAAWEDPEWAARHQYLLDVALMWAQTAAPFVRVNGWTAAEILAEDRDQRAAVREPAHHGS